MEETTHAKGNSEKKQIPVPVCPTQSGEHVQLTFSFRVVPLELLTGKKAFYVDGPEEELGVLLRHDCAGHTALLSFTPWVAEACRLEELIECGIRALLRRWAT
ncbi:hypothetical protein QYE76_054189 [Lolium multiflorum]|uniref:Uncharacterized protein n=1 Tax=Lolium multiflorum TaxID=4521 RepID=A0AAD8SYN4_LOLMU|nr:hypothetical protein QYE76_054189 [Lolium multiflorum]